MKQQPSGLPITAVVSVPLRPDPGGHLTMANVRAARWRTYPGCRLRITCYALKGWDPGVPEQIGRILHDARPSAVEVQMNASSGTLRDFMERIQAGAAQYAAVTR